MSGRRGHPTAEKNHQGFCSKDFQFEIGFEEQRAGRQERDTGGSKGREKHKGRGQADRTPHIRRLVRNPVCPKSGYLYCNDAK